MSTPDHGVSFRFGTQNLNFVFFSRILSISDLKGRAVSESVFGVMEATKTAGLAAGWALVRPKFQTLANAGKAAVAAAALCGALFLAASGEGGEASPTGRQRVTLSASDISLKTSLHAAAAAAQQQLQRQQQPSAPTLPAGWAATWDAQVHRYYFFNTATKETSWDLPQIVPAQYEDIIQNKLAAPPPSSVQDSIPSVMEYWKKRAAQEMQDAKNRGFDAAVAENYDNYDVAKGRAMHKVYHGVVGGGEGYWPSDPPHFPAPGEVANQGRAAAVAENYYLYDVAHGIAIQKGAGQGGLGDKEDGHPDWHYHFRPHETHSDQQFTRWSHSLSLAPTRSCSLSHSQCPCRSISLSLTSSLSISPQKTKTWATLDAAVGRPSVFSH